MTPGPGESAARLVLRWCAMYTRGLPATVAADRRSELESDLHEHRSATLGTAAPTIGRDVLVRAAVGIPADLSWRTHQKRIARSAPQPEVAMPDSRPLDAWTRTAYGVAAIVTAWSAVVGVTMLLDARNAEVGSYDFGWRIGLGSLGLIMLGLCIHGLLGLRSHPVRAAAEFGAAAVTTTVWMLWAGLVVALGAAALAFFVAFAVRSHRAGRARHELAAAA